MRSLTLLLVLVVSLLSGCVALPEATTATGGASEPSVEEVMLSDEGVPSIMDANGNEVVIEDASRIITLGGPVTEIVFALGAGDQVVARDSSSSFPEEIKELPDVGYQRRLSSEGVLALDPTLILATTEAGPPEAIEQLQDSGVTFVMLDAADTVEGVYTKIRGFGQVLEREAEAEELVAKIEADLTKAKEIASSQETKPRVMFIYARGAGAVSVAGFDTGAQFMIELAGGESAVMEYEGYKPITPESAVAAAPDVILMMESGLESLGGESGLLEVPGIAQTPAGESENFLAMDGLFLLNFGPRMGEAAIALAEAIHE